MIDKMSLVVETSIDPLIKICGLSLIERSVLAAHSKGIKKFDIVLSRDDPRIKDHILLSKRISHISDNIEINYANKPDPQARLVVGSSYIFHPNLLNSTERVVLTSDDHASLSRIEIPYLFRLKDGGMVKEAEYRILNSCRKDNDGVIARYIDRYISIFISRFLCKTTITPNQVSVLVFLMGVISFFFMIKGSFLYLLIGVLFYKFSQTIDGCDGEIAKSKFQTSRLGEWMDTLFDNLATVMFLSAISILLYRQEPVQCNVYLGILAVGSYLLCILSMFSVLLIKYKGKGSLVVINDGIQKNIFLTVIAYLMKRDLFSVIFIVLVLFGLYSLVLWLNIIASIGTTIYSIFALFKTNKI